MKACDREIELELSPLEHIKEQCATPPTLTPLKELKKYLLDKAGTNSVAEVSVSIDLYKKIEEIEKRTP
jgi:hypothetical protein